MGRVAAEQSFLENGRWSTAWLLTFLPEPPWGKVGYQPSRDAVRPIAKLAKPVWVAAALQYTTDAARMVETRKKGGGKGTEDA